MVKRASPCKECRKRRRKCIRSSVYDVCSRCKRLDRECIDGSDEEFDCIELDEELPLLQKQVDELSLIIEKMENQIYTLSQNNNNNNSSCDSINNNDHDDDCNKQLTTTNYLYTNIKNSNNNNKLWNLTFHNGSLRIETGIRSISDLLMQCLPIQYLSPLQSSSSSSTNGDDMIVQFNSGDTIRFMPLTVKLMIKCLYPTFNPIPLLLPATFDIDYVAKKLINIYFRCTNTYKPLIHEKTFMQHYRSLKSPLDSLICLSICCSVCASPCDHIFTDPYEFRQLADFFYDLAKTKFMNQFDESSKRLENVITINLLTDYMLAVMKLEDFKILVTIGCRLCLDLESWFESTKEQGNTVERALYSRHFFFLFLSQGLLSLIANEPMHYLLVTHPEWLLLENEPKEIAEFISMQNRIIQLYNNPFLSNIKSQIHFLLKGGPFSLKFESIIRMEDIFKEWWNDVPPKYRICDNWWDLEECKAAIDKCEVDEDLTLFNYFISFMIDIYSFLLQPNASGTSNDQILSVVQQLSLKKSLDYCQMLIHSQLKSILLPEKSACHSVMNTGGYFFHTIDALITLASSKNDTIRATAKETLAKTRDVLNQKQIMRHNKVDTSCSPLLAGVRANDINSIRISEYFNYPQPWLAVIYDLAHHLDKVKIMDGIPSLID